ncbi:Fatty acid amide hydrolase 1 [Orchesella cincta]|uniref:Fatty acid amide hydrolase 1 n=1 Tax=Orchesella cincta TaxID=48709 RepID=A0A1D2NHS9_ORCCI|nr:Fatty acid amide hydrolase 1 [Orchesella cincta]
MLKAVLMHKVDVYDFVLLLNEDIHRDHTFQSYVSLASGWGSSNPIFGETKNSLNPALAPGGSSSGEGSLIASGGSLFGIGTDAAGSVRIPAHFNGISSLKPTRMRLSPTGVYSSAGAIIGISAVAGLMGKSAGFIKKVFQTLTTNDLQKQYDRLTMPLPWNENLFSSKRPMRIGYYTNMAFFPVHGDTEEVVLNAKLALESAGHSLIPVEIPDSFEVMKVFSDLAYADGGQTVCKIWKDEPVAQAAIFHFWMSWIPRSIRVMLAAVMSSNLLPFFQSSRIATMFRGGAEKSSELMVASANRGKLLQQMAKEWEKHNLDLLLAPTFPFAAVPLKDAGYLKPAIIHTLMWNMFDWPAGVVRFGTESGKKLEEYNTEGDMLLKWAHQAAQHSSGMPISVQLVGLPFQEETVLRGMIELQNIYNKNATLKKTSQ